MGFGRLVPVVPFDLTHSSGLWRSVTLPGLCRGSLAMQPDKMAHVVGDIGEPALHSDPSKTDGSGDERWAVSAHTSLAVFPRSSTSSSCALSCAAAFVSAQVRLRLCAWPIAMWFF